MSRTANGRGGHGRPEGSVRRIGGTPGGSAPDRATPSAAATVGELGEFGLIDRLTEGRFQPEQTLLGPGDDAAVVAAPDGRVVATVDTLVEGVHFRLDWSAPEQVGQKAVAANLSDVAAMGAVPTALLLSLACPGTTSTEVLDGLASGVWDAAADAGIGVVGGDTVSSDTIVVSITALGSLEGREAVTRSGARAGDVVAVCGQLGWSAAGMAVLRRGFRSPVAMVAAHRTPAPALARRSGRRAGRGHLDDRHLGRPARRPRARRPGLAACTSTSPRAWCRWPTSCATSPRPSAATR